MRQEYHIYVTHVIMTAIDSTEICCCFFAAMIFRSGVYIRSLNGLSCAEKVFRSPRLLIDMSFCLVDSKLHDR